MKSKLKLSLPTYTRWGGLMSEECLFIETIKDDFISTKCRVL